MSIRGMAMLAAAGQAFISAIPTGRPTNGSLYRYGGNLVGVQWTNGDGSATTQVRYAADCPAQPIEDNTLFKGNASPGQTTLETQDPDSGDLCSYWIAHLKGGVYSEWFQITTTLDAEECAACPV